MCGCHLHALTIKLSFQQQLHFPRVTKTTAGTSIWKHRKMCVLYFSLFFVHEGNDEHKSGDNKMPAATTEAAAE